MLDNAILKEKGCVLGVATGMVEEDLVVRRATAGAVHYMDSQGQAGTTVFQQRGSGPYRDLLDCPSDALIACCGRRAQGLSKPNSSDPIIRFRVSQSQAAQNNYLQDNK